MVEAEPSGAVDRFVVRAVRGHWRVIHGGLDEDTFPDSESAVIAACRAARAAALDGRATLVMAETVPQELHCFMPRPGAASGAKAPSQPSPGHLRLILPDA